MYMFLNSTRGVMSTGIPGVFKNYFCGMEMEGTASVNQLCNADENGAACRFTRWLQGRWQGKGDYLGCEVIF
jgi:hypothetical protein